MFDALICGQEGCNVGAAWRFFWPGHEPSLACTPHKDKALGIARVMGFALQVEPLVVEGGAAQGAET